MEEYVSLYEMEALGGVEMGRSEPKIPELVRKEWEDHVRDTQEREWENEEGSGRRVTRDQLLVAAALSSTSRDGDGDNREADELDLLLETAVTAYPRPQPRTLDSVGRTDGREDGVEAEDAMRLRLSLLEAFVQREELAPYSPVRPRVLAQMAEEASSAQAAGSTRVHKYRQPPRGVEDPHPHHRRAVEIGAEAAEAGVVDDVMSPRRDALRLIELME